MKNKEYTINSHWNWLMKKWLILVNHIRTKFIEIFQKLSERVMVKTLHLQSVLGPGHGKPGCF